MISIYDSGWRGLGSEGREQYIKVGFDFRNHLHLFQGAKLAVFMALILHCDKKFRCRPSIRLLQEETGYSRPTIIAAIEELCNMEINGQRILCKWRKKGKEGQPEGSTRYKVLPTPAEVAWAEGGFDEMLDDEGGKETLPGVVKKFNQGGKKILPGGGKKILPEVEPYIEVEPKKENISPDKSGEQAKRGRGYVNPETGVSTNDIKASYLQAIESWEPNAIINHGETAKWAKVIAEKGYTPEQVRRVVDYLKGQDFWRGRNLGLGSVAKQMGAVLGRIRAEEAARKRSALYCVEEL